MTPSILTAAQLVFLSWYAVAGSREIPLSDRSLDRALEALSEREEFTRCVGRQLTFANGRLGKQCVEAEELVSVAYTALLIEYTPSFTGASVCFGDSYYRKLTEQYGLTHERIQDWGRLMQQAIEAHQSHRA